jgi:WD40 repeat protein
VHVAQTFKHTSPLVSCRFDPAGRFVFAGAQDNKIVRWELSTGKATELAGHDSWVRGFAFPAMGETLITAGYDGRLMWWPTAAEQPTPTRTVDAHVGWIRAVALSPNGQLLATCGNDLKVKLWNVADGSLVREFAGHERHVYHVAFHPDGKHLASGDLVAKFIDWDLETGAKTREFAIASLTKYDAGFLADYGGPHGLSFSPDGKRLLASGITNVTNAFAGVGNPILVQIDWEAGKDAVTHLIKANPNGVAWGSAFHADGFVIGAIGGQMGGHLFFWKPDQKDEFHTINLSSPARDLAVHPDGLRVATPHHDSNLRVCVLGPKAG